MRFLLLGVMMLALPHVAGKIAEDAREVMVATATGRGGLPKHTATDDAAKSLMRGLPPEQGVAPKRDALIFGQTI